MLIFAILGLYFVAVAILVFWTGINVFQSESFLASLPCTVWVLFFALTVGLDTHSTLLGFRMRKGHVAELNLLLRHFFDKYGMRRVLVTKSVCSIAAVAVVGIVAGHRIEVRCIIFALALLSLAASIWNYGMIAVTRIRRRKCVLPIP